MNNLSIIQREGQFYADSREVAEMVEKRHDHLLRDINGYVDVLSKSTAPRFGVSSFFIQSTYEDNTGRTLPCYLITRKGCDMVANKMTGQKGVLFTAAYVTKFEEMEKAQKPKLTAMEMLRLQNQAIEEMDDRVSAVEDKLKNQMTIDHSKQRTLQNHVTARIYKRIEENLHIGVENNIQKCRPYYFQSLYKDLKNRFGVASYRDIKISQYDDAINYINNWIEPAGLRQRAS